MPEFVLMWGAMMAAMMLPSALPMFLMYRTVKRGLPSEDARAIPVTLFAAVYLLVWFLTGFPVYAASVVVTSLAESSPAFHAALPNLLVAVLLFAGIYQFTKLKEVCLRYCESPLTFLMGRWRPGYRATLKIAFQHAAYCIGCCWVLMVILVAAGAMSLPWVLGISAVVFAEKVLPHGQRTAHVVGIALILLAIAVALKPELAHTMRGPQMKAHALHSLLWVPNPRGGV